MMGLCKGILRLSIVLCLCTTVHRNFHLEIASDTLLLSGSLLKALNCPSKPIFFMYIAAFLGCSASL